MTHHRNSRFSGRTMLFAVAILAGGASGADPSFALGGGDNSDSQTNCKTGFHWDFHKQECVRNQSNNDSSLSHSGRHLALAGRCQEALDILDGRTRHA